MCVLLPLGLHLQRRLACAPGLIDVTKVDELLLVLPERRPTGFRRAAREVG